LVITEAKNEPQRRRDPEKEEEKQLRNPGNQQQKMSGFPSFPAFLGSLAVYFLLCLSLLCASASLWFISS
jgi:hypothetical protein